MPSGTSRGILREKDSWFIKLEYDGKIGIGECSIINGLSIENSDIVFKNLEKLQHVNIHSLSPLNQYKETPAVRFALEMAMKSLASYHPHILYPSEFTKLQKGIPINGLVWMGEKQFMFDQIAEKIDSGFSCIKIKIAAIDFNDEIGLLKYIRQQFTPSEIEIRVDANGGFSTVEALEKLKVLSDYNLHSIEQPIGVSQHEEMASLCMHSPLHIALDEELIGIHDVNQKEKLLSTIKPHYIILKPSLIGGFDSSEEWISVANNLNIGWWVTSALESNVGLNAIAQWTATLESDMYQGLGTGQLFTNNIDSPLYIKEGQLFHSNASWAPIFD